MSKIYFATVVAIFVTTSLATNLLVVGTRGPATPGLCARLWSGSRRMGRRFKYSVDRWVAATLARRERQAASWALCYMTDRELKDIGLDRGGLGRGSLGRDGLDRDDGYAGRTPQPGTRMAFSVSHAEEGRSR
jgi:uncharacterized protein YjiS (DUF1127 family)